MSAFVLAYIAGLVTILNPCVLPMLPILISSAVSENRFGPLALMGGLVFSLSAIGILLTAFGFSIGLSQDGLRPIAGGILLLAGILLVVPKAQQGFATAMGPVVNRGNQLLGRISGNGLAGQALIGLVLGVVWAPCTGPTLGAAIGAASAGNDLGAAFLTFLIFGLGIATSMLAFTYGSRKALGARRDRFKAIGRYAKPMLGGSLLLVGVMLITGLDKQLEAALLDIMPLWLVDFTTRF
ncbi:MAG: cytochrome c biogenesis CcdA family protein [Alphaproteobacteria bacterium]